MSTNAVQSLSCIALVVICLGIALANYILHRLHKRTISLITAKTSCHLFPVAMSLSAINIGPFMWQISTGNSGMAALLVTIGHFLAAVVSALFITPLLYSLKLTTISQIFLKRFRSPRFLQLAAIWNIVTTFVMCVVTYLPCKMLAVLSDVSIGVILLGSLLLCAVIMSLGGVRAVIHCEAVLYIFLLSGFIYLLAVSWIYDSENMEKWEKSNTAIFEDGVFNSPSVWWSVIPGFITNLSMFAVTQSSLQRINATKSSCQASLSVMLQIMFSAILHLVIIHSSLTVTTADDWVERLNGNESSEQSLAFLYSLLLAAVLSSLSPLLLSINTLTYEDIIIHSRLNRWARRNSSWFLRLLALLFCGLLFCYGLMMAHLPTQLRRQLRALLGTLAFCLDGPLALAVLVSIILPIVNTQGILVALIVTSIGELAFHFSTRFYLSELVASSHLSSSLQHWNDSLYIYNNTYYHVYYDYDDIPNDAAITNRMDMLQAVNPDFVNFVAMVFFLVVSVAVSICTGVTQKHPRSQVETLVPLSCLRNNNESSRSQILRLPRSDSDRLNGTPLRRASEGSNVHFHRKQHQAARAATSHSLF